MTSEPAQPEALSALDKLIDLPALKDDPDMRAALDDLVAAMAYNTRRAYISDLFDFHSWCTREHRPWNDHLAIAAYLRYLASHGTALTTTQRRVAAIHKLWELHITITGDQDQWDPTKHPIVKNAMKAIRKQTGTDRNEAPPLTAALLLETLLAIDTTTLAGQRDTALLLIGWSGALRRSELAGIHRDHLTFEPEGVIIALPNTKTVDHTQHIAIAAHTTSRWCPVTHLTTWLNRLDTTPTTNPTNIVWARTTRAKGTGTIHQPPATISDTAIANIIKQRIRQAAIPNANNYSAHSLRAGFITEAKNRSVDEADIMKHTRHKSVAIMRGYDRKTGHWHRNPSTNLTI